MRIFKRLAACVFAAAMAVSVLAACSGGSVSISAQEKLSPLAAPTSTAAYENSRIAKAAARLPLDRLYINADMSTTTENVVRNCVIMLLPNKLYIRDLAEGGNITMYDGKAFYLIATEAETVYKLSIGSDEATAVTDAVNMKTPTVGCGTLTLDGASYYFESMSETDSSGETETVYYCFDEADTAGANIRYIISESSGARTTLKINEISSNVDESVFTIPSDYMVMGF